MAIPTRRSRKWWKEATIYQIYPASFCDFNGDGVGDIAGIRSKLDYLSSLGVDAIWICPVYESPQVDMGYDVSDYESIYAPYGTLDEMEALIHEAHGRGIRVMMDLVINHTSDQHAWFRESRSSIDSPKRDWYIWRPARYVKGERLPPNNWRCHFGGGSAWEWDEHTGQYYLHLFAKEQPDVNWENAVTRQAIFESAMIFWLERGIDGFRIDMVNAYSKPVDFPDAPITDAETSFQTATALYSNGPRIHEYVGEINAILARYGAVSVGELPYTHSTERVLRYVSEKAKQLDMVFQFNAVDVGYGTTHKYETTVNQHILPQFTEAISQTQELIHGTDAWTAVFLENHDLSRSVSRFTNDQPQYRIMGAKLLCMLQCCLSGTQFIYQGQEIGAINAPKETYPLENYVDVDSRLFMEKVRDQYGSQNTDEIERAFTALQHLSRDQARVPMAWNGQKNGGFSEQTESEGRQPEEPWMKPHPLAHEINVASQIRDPGSALEFWRKMLRFRKQHKDLLIYGDYRPLRLDSPTMYSFVKEVPGNTKVVIALNFSTQQATWIPPNAQDLGIDGESCASLHIALSTHEGKHHSQVFEPFEGRVYFYEVLKG